MASFLLNAVISLVLPTCVEWCKAAHIIVIRVDQTL